MSQHLKEGVYIIALTCPVCGYKTELSIAIWPRLIIDRQSTRIGPQVKATPVDHICGRSRKYTPEGQIDGQTTIEDHLTDEDQELADRVAELEAERAAGVSG